MRCAATGASIVLGNTYHLMLRPGADRVARLGGLHRFMDWPGPILTDSGGFQVMSLAALRKLDEDGVTFQLAYRRLAHRLTPERASRSSTARLRRSPWRSTSARHSRPRRSRRARAWSCPCAGPRAAATRSGHAPATACSASTRAAFFPTFAPAPPRRCRKSASTATRSAASRSAKARRQCSRCWTARRRCCRRTARAT